MTELQYLHFKMTNLRLDFNLGVGVYLLRPAQIYPHS